MNESFIKTVTFIILITLLSQNIVWAEGPGMLMPESEVEWLGKLLVAIGRDPSGTWEQFKDGSMLEQLTPEETTRLKEFLKENWDSLPDSVKFLFLRLVPKTESRVTRAYPATKLMEGGSIVLAVYYIAGMLGVVALIIGILVYKYWVKRQEEKRKQEEERRRLAREEELRRQEEQRRMEEERRRLAELERQERERRPEPEDIPPPPARPEPARPRREVKPELPSGPEREMGEYLKGRFPPDVVELLVRKGMRFIKKGVLEGGATPVQLAEYLALLEGNRLRGRFHTPVRLISSPRAQCKLFGRRGEIVGIIPDLIVLKQGAEGWGYEHLKKHIPDFKGIDSEEQLLYWLVKTVREGYKRRYSYKNERGVEECVECTLYRQETNQSYIVIVGSDDSVITFYPENFNDFNLSERLGISPEQVLLLFKILTDRIPVTIDRHVPDPASIRDLVIGYERNIGKERRIQRKIYYIPGRRGDPPAVGIWHHPTRRMVLMDLNGRVFDVRNADSSRDKIDITGDIRRIDQYYLRENEKEADAPGSRKTARRVLKRYFSKGQGFTIKEYLEKLNKLYDYSPTRGSPYIVHESTARRDLYGLEREGVVYVDRRHKPYRFRFIDNNSSLRADSGQTLVYDKQGRLTYTFDRFGNITEEYFYRGNRTYVSLTNIKRDTGIEEIDIIWQEKGKYKGEAGVIINNECIGDVSFHLEGDTCNISWFYPIGIESDVPFRRYVGKGIGETILVWIINTAARKGSVNTLVMDTENIPLIRLCHRHLEGLMLDDVVFENQLSQSGLYDHRLLGKIAVFDEGYREIGTLKLQGRGEGDNRYTVLNRDNNLLLYPGDEVLIEDNGLITDIDGETIGYAYQSVDSHRITGKIKPVCIGMPPDERAMFSRCYRRLVEAIRGIYPKWEVVDKDTLWQIVTDGKLPSGWPGLVTAMRRDGVIDKDDFILVSVIGEILEDTDLRDEIKAILTEAISIDVLLEDNRFSSEFMVKLRKDLSHKGDVTKVVQRLYQISDNITFNEETGEVRFQSIEDYCFIIELERLLGYEVYNEVMDRYLEGRIRRTLEAHNFVFSDRQLMVLDARDQETAKRKFITLAARYYKGGLPVRLKELVERKLRSKHSKGERALTLHEEYRLFTEKMRFFHDIVSLMPGNVKLHPLSELLQAEVDRSV